jgi:hypothetical protein
VSADAELSMERAFVDLSERAEGAVGDAAHRGYHNQNVRIDLEPAYAKLFGCSTVKLRMRLDAPLLVQRVWPDESELLDRMAKEGLGDRPGDQPVEIPRVIYSGGWRGALHSYPEGVPLATVSPAGRAVSGQHLRIIMRFIGRLSAMGRTPVPQLPDHWPRDGDSDRFLRDRVEFAAASLAGANEPEYGGLLSRLGIHAGAMEGFGERLPALRSRPFALLHTDLHRHNILVGADGRLAVIDWEHAMFGDPLYELATHMARMRYPAGQIPDVLACWRQAMSDAGCQDATAAMNQDLPHYVGYERAQSVYPDVMRAARAYTDSRDDDTLRRVSAVVVETLERARDPLLLPRVPDAQEVAEALRDFVGVPVRQT